MSAAVYVLRRHDGSEIASTYVTGSHRFDPRCWALEETLADIDGTSIQPGDLEWTGAGYHDIVMDEPLSLLTIRQIPDHDLLSTAPGAARMLQAAE